MRVLLTCALLVVAAAASARASDISGKWTGTVEIKPPDSETVTQPFWAKFRQSAQEVTGTAGGGDSDAALEIRNGSLDGKKLTFQVTDEHGVSYKVNLVASNEDRFEGTVDFSLPDGSPMTGKLVLNRDEKH